jgi:hypothetical protein
VIVSQKREEGRRRKKKRKRDTIQVFFLFLQESRILIFIKNNMENTKYILTVRSNSV